MLALLSGAKMKVLHSYPVGYWRAMHFVGTRVAAQRGLHDVQQNLNLLTAFSRTPREASSPRFAVMLSERAAAGDALAALGFGEDVKPIVIHAGSAQTVLAQAKRWPPASYGQLIAALNAEFGDRVLLIEGPDERGVADEILQSPGIAIPGLSPKVVRLSGPLGEAAAILERAALYVGSDSGLAHLAAAVGTPAVTLFAPAEPDRVSPFGYRDLVVQAQTPCSPCAQYPWLAPHPKIFCREPMCITTITVDAVMEKVRLAMALERVTQS
jgi:ADP-heptose:LPS heptosyltransferase